MGRGNRFARSGVQVRMFEKAILREPRSALVDWVLRGAIATAFVLFGTEKFPGEVGSHWVKLFGEIGLGQWFRVFTGVVEILGAVMLLIPRAVWVGLALLAATMASAAAILIFAIGRPADSVVSVMFFIGQTAVGLSRRNG